MENASKALIIAGAILLSILIIGLGMFIYSQAAGAMGSANLDPEKIAAYNSKFEQYEGTQNGTNARSLCDLIRNHNNANLGDPTQQVQLTNDGNPKNTPATEAVKNSDIADIKSKIKQGNTYTISFGYDNNTGYIVGVDIK